MTATWKHLAAMTVLIGLMCGSAYSAEYKNTAFPSVDMLEGTVKQVLNDNPRFIGYNKKSNGSFTVSFLSRRNVLNCYLIHLNTNYWVLGYGNSSALVQE